MLFKVPWAATPAATSWLSAALRAISETTAVKHGCGRRFGKRRPTRYIQEENVACLFVGAPPKGQTSQIDKYDVIAMLDVDSSLGHALRWRNSQFESKYIVLCCLWCLQVRRFVSAVLQMLCPALLVSSEKGQCLPSCRKYKSCSVSGKYPSAELAACAAYPLLHMEI